MIGHTIRIVAVAGCAAAAALGSSRVVAQTPAAPAAVAGQWELNRELTDRPEQIAAAIRADFGPPAQEQGFGGAGEGRYGRGRRQPGEPRPPQGGSNQEANRQDQDQIDALTARLRYPPTSLTIAQSGTTVTFTDPQNGSRSVDVNGRKTKTTLGSSEIEVSARYEGPQLVIEENPGKGRTITWTYAVLPSTRQLLVRVAISRAPGELGAFEIKYVYDARTS
jgi:hypothetical protein